MKLDTVLAGAALSAAMFGCHPAARAPEELDVTPDGLTVVTEAKTTPAARFAAKELTRFLGRAYGRAIAESHQLASNGVSLVVGDTAWSRAAGIDVAALPRDAFAIRVDPAARRVYIAGRDSSWQDPEKAVEHGGYPRVECATLYGVYGFLERFYGCRFYFPGEFGEIVPTAAPKKVLPVGDFGQKPVYTVRYVYLSGDGEGYLAPTNRFGNYSEKSLNWLRLRMETEVTPCCHGLNSFGYAQKFQQSHPEYFALLKEPNTGKLRRDNDPKRHLAFHFGQLCHSSAVRDVLAGDVRKRFADGARYVDVMPQDGFAKCLCPDCTAAYREGDRDYASELVWGKTAELARGLRKDGIKGMLTMMAYSPYRRIPDIDIPTNILVMVAEQGPWEKVRPASFRRANDEVKGWAKKMGRKVWVWTYPHKYQQSAVPTLPQMTPRAWGEYYKALQPWIFGTFAETESDRWIYNYLNYYVFSRIAWDADADLDAILAEHYRLMFGAAADDMRAFYELLEKTWLEGMQNNVDDTPLGPVARIPPPLTIWREIYSPAMIRRCADCFVRAGAKVAPGSMEAKRLRFVREQFLDPLAASSRDYLKGVSVDEELRRRAASKAVNLVDRTPDACYNHGKKMPVREEGVRPGVRSAYRLDSDYANVEWALDLKPGTTYRISYFLKAKDLFKREDWKGCFGGATVEFSDGVNELRNPTPFEDGTFDWIHRSFTVTTPPKEKMSKRPYVRPWMLHGRGIAWFDGFRVEEVR